MTRLTTLIKDCIDMCKTYPLVILGTAIIVILGIYTNHRYDYTDANSFDIFFEIQASIAIVLPLLLASYLFFGSPYSKKIIAQIIIIVLAIVYYFYLHGKTHNDSIVFVATNFTLIMGSISLFFLSHRNKIKQQDQQLWFADANIIGSVVIAVIFTGALCLGIAAIFKSLEYLFDILIQRSYMTDIMLVVMGFGGMILFLKRVTHHTSMTYPKLLEIFAKYILASLVGIYALILLAYGIKILLTGIWPKGEVVYMVMGYFALGFATTLCLYPLTNTPNYKRVRTFNLGFYISSLPILFLGFMSLYLRVDQYGRTINRYLVVAILCFFACLGIFNIIYKNYKTFGLFSLLSSFCVIILLPVVGFGDIIRNYQTHKLAQVLQQAHALDTDGKFINNLNLTGEDAKNLYSVVDYIGSTFDAKAIHTLSAYNEHIITDIPLTGNRYTQNEILKGLFGLSGYNGWNDGYYNRPTINRYSDSNNNAFDISGYTQLSIINYYNGGDTTTPKTVSITDKGDGTQIIVDGKPYTLSFTTILNQYGTLLNYKDSGSYHTELLTGENYKAIITEFEAYKDPEWKINHYKLYLLTK